MSEFERMVEDRIVQSLKAFPVVYIAGPRQSGKTTLTQRIAATRHPARYLTFDDLQLRAAAAYDPETFLRSFDGPVVLDEIQLVPELFRPLKIIVDENRKRVDEGRGQFLLIGSASVMALPQLSEALLGRMALYNLLAFSIREIQQKKQLTFIEDVFSNEWKFTQFPRINLMEMMMQASFPELLSLESDVLRYEWCNAYINTVLQRDVKVLLEIEKIAVLPDLLRLFAARTGGLLNEASLSRDTGLNHITAKRYRLLLESLFLLQSIPAWSNNLGKRLIKAPKIYTADLNLLAYLLNIRLQELPQINSMLFGAVLENFVAMELIKQMTFSSVAAKLYHYRTAAGQEVDFILEGPQTRIVGIEVKSKSKLNVKDFQHLQALQAALGEKFHRGIVLYQGAELVPFGKDLWAVPFTMLCG